MNSQFGLANVWSQGDIVTKSVAVLLLGDVAGLVDGHHHQIAGPHQIQAHRPRGRRLLAQRDFAAGLAKLGGDPTNPFRQLALEGREATLHHRNTKAHLHDALDVSDWVTRTLRNAIDEFTAKLQSGLAVLASVGSTAPSSACSARCGASTMRCCRIGVAGQATIDKVSAPSANR